MTASTESAGSTGAPAPAPVPLPMIDTLTELGEILVVTRRFRDHDLALEDARSVLARVRELTHRALIGLRMPVRIDPEQLRRIFGAPSEASAVPPGEAPKPGPELDDGLPPMIVGSLRRAGVRSFADLARFTRDEALRGLGLGQLAIAQIAQELDARGLRFKGEEQ